MGATTRNQWAGTKYEASEAQVSYVRAMQRKLKLTDALLDTHCERTWGCPLRDLDRGLVSKLIDEMLGWKRIPASLMREAGQLDLMELEP